MKTLEQRKRDYADLIAGIVAGWKAKADADWKDGITGSTCKDKGFDTDACKSAVGDERMRLIEAKARTDADASTFNPPNRATQCMTYWSQIVATMEGMVYCSAFKKRTERVSRMAQRPHINQQFRRRSP